MEWVSREICVRDEKRSNELKWFTVAGIVIETLDPSIKIGGGDVLVLGESSGSRRICGNLTGFS